MESSKVRILYRPLVIGPRGKILPANMMDYGQLLFDPLKFSPDGVVEAAIFSNPEQLAAKIAAYPEQAEIVNHLLPEEAAAEYKKQVMPFKGTAEFKGKVRTFLDISRKSAIVQPEKFLAAIYASRDSAARLDKFLPAFVDDHAKSVVSLRGMKADTGYASDGDFVATAQMMKSHLRSEIKQLPDFVRANLESDPVTVAYMGTLPRPQAYAEAQPDASQILLNGGQLDGATLPTVRAVLRQTAVEYLDGKMHFSEQPEFRAVADRLIDDDDRITRLYSTTQKFYRQENATMPEHGSAHNYSELLAEYVHVKEHLKANRPQWETFARASGKGVQNELREIFGAEMCALGEKFESTLRAQAQMDARSPN